MSEKCKVCIGRLAVTS